VLSSEISHVFLLLLDRHGRGKYHDAEGQVYIGDFVMVCRHSFIVRFILMNDNFDRVILMERESTP